MRVIRRGMFGQDVEAWQYFLRGQGIDGVEVDGRFDGAAVEATKAWQSQSGLVPDGVVGPRTYGKAQEQGFDPGFVDTDDSELGPNWPPKPAFPALSAEQRGLLLGEFAFKPAPTPGNAEAIEILDDWPKRNIVSVVIPQLADLTGAPANASIRLHRLAAEPFRQFFQAIDDAGLKSRLLSFGGSWAARFIRGSRSALSNHAFGSALDLNVPWNMLGTMPALKGRRGSVRELVSIAHAHGIYWGGHFTRQDGMHFELATLVAGTADPSRA